MARSPNEIIDLFIHNKYPHQKNIPGNRVFYTDMTASTLVWVEGQVVIEYYLMFPNIHAPMHSHPFINQMIFMGGELTGHKSTAEFPSRIRSKIYRDIDIGVSSSFLPIGDLHGFETGKDGAVLYNIQIWPKDVDDPRSAAIEYIGNLMGPIHQDLIQNR